MNNVAKLIRANYMAENGLPLVQEIIVTRC